MQTDYCENRLWLSWMWALVNVVESNAHNWPLKLFVPPIIHNWECATYVSRPVNLGGKTKGWIFSAPFIFYLLFNPPISLTSVLCVKLLQRAILPLICNNPASRMRRGGEKKPSDPSTFEAGGISVGTVSATVPLRCLIDRGCVKSDSLFCSTARWPALPCLRCFEKQVVYPNTGLTLWDNTPLRW